MASLTGNKIKDTYQGLMKTSDNGVIDANLKNVTDGAGNATPLWMANNYVQLQAPTIELIESTGGTNLIQIDATQTLFEGNVDFTNATVTGLPTGSAGLVSGTGADSMQSAASLTTIAADATGAQSIALGDGACSTGLGSTAIGDSAKALANGAVAVGGTSSGSGVTASGICAVAIGQRMNVSGACAVGLGYRAESTALHGISIGTLSGGNQACSIAIGVNANANAIAAVALGAGVIAAKASTVSVTELETQLAGGGIYLTTPDGLAQPKLTVDNSSNLLIGGNPVGGAGLESGTGADSMQSAASLTTLAANAGGTCAIALGNNALANCPNSIAIGADACADPLFGTNGSIVIGKSANTARGNVVVIGNNSSASDTNSTVIGTCSLGQNNHATVVGYQSCANSCAVAIGNIAQANAASSIALGDGACATGPGSIALGLTAKATDSLGGVAIGRLAQNPSRGGVAIGNDARTPSVNFAISIGYSSRGGGADSISIGQSANAAQDCSIALGRSSSTSAAEAVAIGRGVVAAKASTVTVRELETCVAGGGITLKSADLTEEKMTLTDADVLAVGGDTIPANDSATPTVVNRIWSGSQAQYDALGTYDANTLYYIA